MSLNQRDMDNWIRQIVEEYGYTTIGELLEDLMSQDSGVCPALCPEGCEVEPDGTCPHGRPSVLIAMGLI